MEFPAITLVIFCLLYTGRRATLILLFGICGTSLILTYFVPEYMTKNTKTIREVELSKVIF